jgi:menaquinone-dependent protoporphyrinogen oxidase
MDSHIILSFPAYFIQLTDINTLKRLEAAKLKPMFNSPCVKTTRSGDTMKALIAYGTRFGATTGTSEEIAKILRTAGYDTKIANLREEKIKDISEYDLILVGSGMKMGKWVNESKDFLKNFQEEINQKKLALFVSSMQALAEKQGKTDKEGGVCSASEVAENIVAEYGLKPITIGIFGGVINYNKMGFFERKVMGFLKPQLEKDGFKETEPGLYDMRDWDEIRNWANELCVKARQ